MPSRERRLRKARRDLERRVQRLRYVADRARRAQLIAEALDELLADPPVPLTDAEVEEFIDVAYQQHQLALAEEYAQELLRDYVPPLPLPRLFAPYGNPRATGAYRQQRYREIAPRALTAAQLAEQIAAVAENTPGYAHATVTFHDAQTGEAQNRVVHGRTPADIAANLDRLETLRIIGNKSDALVEGLELDPSQFTVGYRMYPAGGAKIARGVSRTKGRDHPHFKLLDFSGKSSEGDCLLAVLRGVASSEGLPPPKAPNGKSPANKTIRDLLRLPSAPAPIPAEPRVIDALADLFGLRIRVITGVAVPPDAQRVYDDRPDRLVGPNLCRTVAEPEVIAAGGNADAPACDVFLSDGHYEYISEFFPVDTCPVTGDILDKTAPPTKAQLRARVIAQGRSWYGDRKKRDKPPKKVYRERIIVFDYETVYRDDGELEPYALGFFEFDPESEAAKSGDFSGFAAQVVQTVRKEGQRPIDVSSALLDVLWEAPEDVRYTLVSFNGARFDHFLLAQTANIREMLTGVFATAAGGLRSLTLGRHTTLDLAKLVPGTSLASACRDFRTQPTKVDGFSHVIVQRAYEAGNLYGWLGENGPKLREYLAGDVLSEASLFVRLGTALMALTEQPIYGPNACQTIGGHAWARMSKTCPLPKPVKERQMDEKIRTAIVGGRVQSYRNGVPGKGPLPPVVEDELFMVDFCSLYPTAMSAARKAAAVFRDEELWGYYPSGAQNGEPTVVDDFVPGSVGIYEVTIHEQPPGLPNVLPRRDERESEPLDWEFRGEFRAMATHIDVLMIRDYGGRLTIHRGWVWPVSKQGLFEPYIAPLAALKDQQDQLEKSGSAEFNPAYRAVLKLLMNSASGKTCQANYEDQVILAKGGRQQLAAERKMRDDAPITWISLSAETCLLIGKKPSDKVYKRTAKPSILAVLIYSYSRALVWRTLCQHNVLYSDTDSGLFRRADYEALRAHFPELDPSGRKKELGDLEQELPSHARAEAHRIAPKDYAVFLFDAKGELLLGKKGSKIRVKGVNQRSDRLIAPEAVGMLASLRTAEYTEEYHSEGTARSRPLSDGYTALEFFRRRSAGEKVSVLSSQLTRTFKDAAAPFALRQRFLLKEL